MHFLQSTSCQLSRPWSVVMCEAARLVVITSTINYFVPHESWPVPRSAAGGWAGTRQLLIVTLDTWHVTPDHPLTWPTSMKESFCTNPSSSSSSSESSSQAERVMVGNSEEELDWSWQNNLRSQFMDSAVSLTFLKVFCCLILFLMDCGAGEPIRRWRSGIWTSSPWQKKIIATILFCWCLFEWHFLCDFWFPFLIINVRFKLCHNLPQAFSSLWIYFLSQGAVMSALFSSCYFPWMITKCLNSKF